MPKSRPPTRMSLAEFAELVKREVGLELRVCMPARVIEYIPPDPDAAQPTPPRARVRCDLLCVRDGDADEVADDPTARYVASEDPNQGGELHVEYGQGNLLVPVHFPGGWGGWSRGALLPGELGKLVFCDRSLDDWQIVGGVGDPIDPVNPWTHGFNLHDAYFEPGTRSGKAMSAADPGPSDIPDDGSAWGLADGSAGLKVRHPTGDVATQRDLALTTTGQLVRIDSAGKVVAGDPATSKAVALAEAIVEIFETLSDNLTSWVVVPNDGGGALKTIVSAPVVGIIAKIAALKNLIASTKLEADQ